MRCLVPISLAVAGLLVSLVPLPVQAVLGDCDGNRQVTVDELIRGVNIGLGEQSLDQCPFFDTDANGEVQINELIGAVNLALSGPPVHVHGQYWGYGRTAGGLGQAAVVVQNDADSGAGSLRAALAAGNRFITFAAPFVIRPLTPLRIKSSNLTVSGWETPLVSGQPTGVTLDGSLLGSSQPILVIEGPVNSQQSAVTDVVITNVRIRGAKDDGIRVASGARRVVVDHVSVSGSADGNVDVVGKDYLNNPTQDVTVSWSVLAEPVALPGNTQKNSLLSDTARRISMHHNLFVTSLRRNPQANQANVTLDLVSNLIWGWGPGEGTTIEAGATANVVNNYYHAYTVAYPPNLPNGGNDNGDSLVVRDAGTAVYAAGNVNPSGVNVNAMGNGAMPMGVEVKARVPAPPATATFCQVRALAGARHQSGSSWLLDSMDQGFVSRVTCNGCTLPTCN